MLRPCYRAFFLWILLVLIRTCRLWWQQQQQPWRNVWGPPRAWITVNFTTFYTAHTHTRTSTHAHSATQNAPLSLAHPRVVYSENAKTFPRKRGPSSQ
uniref:Putative secreted protein n=1 Tax=Anopheles triannulatus TaxID=58253 RepID=A0A2M4B213_9DIPT